MSGENPVDNEAAQLLAEIEAQDAKPAPTANSKSRSRAKPAPAPAPVEEAPVEEAPVEEAQRNRTITNTSKNPRRIGGVTVPVGGTYDLTDHDLSDESLMSKINHSVQMGVLSRGAD